MNKKNTIALIFATFCFVGVFFYLNSQNLDKKNDTYVQSVDSTQLNMKLKILTFNAGLFELRAFGLPVIKPADFLKERLETMPAEILKVDADIIALQEVYFHNHQNFLIEKLKNRYHYYFYKRTSAVKVNNGLMILSKFPITKQFYFPLKNKGPLDERTIAQKGILDCIVNINGFGELRIINLHPTAGGFLYKQDSPEIIEIRNNQINQAYELSTSTKLPTVILGDFNTGPEIAQENYNFLLQKQFIDSYLSFADREGIQPEVTWDAGISLNKKGTHSESISQRIDHIYISPEFQERFTIENCWVVFKEQVVKTPTENVQISDHYGMLTEFKKK